METRHITESRAKVLLYFLGTLAFFAVYVLLPDPDHKLPVWGSWFFGLGTLVFLVLLIRPRQLTMDGEGFSVSGGLTRKPVNRMWRDVTGFFPLRIRMGSSVVGYNYSPDAAPTARGAWLSKRISGADAGISGLWPCSTRDLADKLNAYRNEALQVRATGSVS